MNNRPIVFNLGAIFVFLIALGIGGVATENTEPELPDNSPISIDEACMVNSGKGLVRQAAAGSRDRTEDECPFEEPEFDLPISAVMLTGNTGSSAEKGWTQKGIASWYGSNFHDGPTASGETYDMYTMTAAHRDLPFDTLVEVTRLDNKDSVVVRINNRGPYIEGRIIDLSKKAADRLGMKGQGLARVRIEVIEVP